MDKRYYFLVAFVVILLFIFMGFSLINEDISKVCFDDKCYNVEIAKTPEELSNGLMYKENLDLDKGMLFVFTDENKHSFWMKNTLIPLDIVWINKDMEVVEIVSAEPCFVNNCPSFVSSQNSLYVLEINYGETLKNGISVGSKVKFS